MNSDKLNTYLNNLYKYINTNKGPDSTIIDSSVRSLVNSIVTTSQEEATVDKIRLKFVREGGLVTFVPLNGEFERGIVKKVDLDMDSAWVVFQCNGDWSNYKDFTPMRVEIKLLRDGWK